MISIDAVNVNSIIKFKDKCLTRNGFTLPAIYPEFVQQNFENTNIVKSVIKCNSVDFERSGTTVKCFIIFLNDLKDSIVYEVGNDYDSEVFYSLDFIDRWEYFVDKFVIDEHESLIEIRNIQECTVISFCCNNVEVQDIWNKIYKLIHKEKLLFDTYLFFTGEIFSENPGVIKFDKGICSMYLI